jgi:5-methylcytosine-specific restriction endonuclease McrA
MNLPITGGLPVNKLAACFNNTSSTYKYYWLLSILQSVEQGNYEILKRELFAKMISNAWYTVNYFNVSFGSQDLIQKAIYSIKLYERITIDENRRTVVAKLLNSRNPFVVRELWHFNKNVPHWFLSPWFPKIGNETNSQRERRIYQSSQKFENLCLYSLENELIRINPDWINYLKSNLRVLKDYCYWNLALFLQTKNPNVPDIPSKLIKPAKRNSLTKQRNKFWDLVLNEIGSLECIYTGKILTKGNYAVEHFIPYSFVSHDLIWNLIPADNSFNSSKSNKLPNLDKYFHSFYLLQKIGYEVIKDLYPRNKLLEDYLAITTNKMETLEENQFFNFVQPLVTIASNNGFEFME